METFDSVLTWLAQGAGAVMVTAWLASWLLEDWRTWQGLGSKAKKLLVLLVALVLGLGGRLLTLQPEWIAAIQPYLDTGVLVVAAWLSTQVAHKVDKLE